jgi:type VI protein secretion system component Hcp
VLSRTLATRSGEPLLQRWAGLGLPTRAPARSYEEVTCTIVGGGPGFKNEAAFALLSYSFESNVGAQVAGSSAPAKGTKGRLHLTKRYDAVSAPLSQAATSGRTIEKVVLVLRRNDGTTYARYTLEDVLATSFDNAGAAEYPPIERLTFEFKSVTWDYSR